MLYRNKKEKNLYLEIEEDEIPDSPRDWDNLGTIYYKHGSYNLGDVEIKGCPYEFFKKNLETKGVILPLYIYEHSGLTISTEPFGCYWDSSQLGWIFVSFEDIKKEYGVKKITKNLLMKVLKLLEGEVEVFRQYLEGEIYQYSVYKLEMCSCCKSVEKDIYDSCSGIYIADGNTILKQLQEDGFIDDAEEWEEVEQ